MTENDSSVFQRLPTPCLVTTLDGTILQVNSALSEFLGKSESDLLGIHLDTITTLASGIFMQTHAWPMLRRDMQVKELYIKINNAQGVSTPIMADCVVREDDGDHTCYWVLYVAQERSKFEVELIAARQDVESINHDLTESRKALKTANDELERFIFNVSHDLRAPLVSINGFAAQLQKELISHLTEKQQHRFERIAFNIKKMQLLMDDLLKLSRISFQDIKFIAIDLNEVIDVQLSLLEKSLVDINAKVQVDSALPMVLSNSTLIGQCLGNLLSNAIAYSEPSRALEIKISAKTLGNMISLDVSDNGIGIAEHDFDRIFNIFEHISSSKGTGVGLAIVKTAVQKMHGSISVVSELGVGTTFSLALPKPENKPLEY